MAFTWLTHVCWTIAQSVANEPTQKHIFRIDNHPELLTSVAFVNVCNALILSATKDFLYDVSHCHQYSMDLSVQLLTNFVLPRQVSTW